MPMPYIGSNDLTIPNTQGKFTIAVDSCVDSVIGYTKHSITKYNVANYELLDIESGFQLLFNLYIKQYPEQEENAKTLLHLNEYNYKTTFFQLEDSLKA